MRAFAQRPQPLPPCYGLEGPVDLVKDWWEARKARKAIEEAERKEREAQERKRRGASWSKKVDTLLAIGKIGVITIPVGILAVSLMPALRGAGTALKGAGEAAAEGAESLRAIRRNPRPLSWSEKRRHLLHLRDRYWEAADAPAFGGTPGQWFLQGVGQGVGDSCLVLETCFSPAIFREPLRHRRELVKEATAAGDPARASYHRGYLAGMKAATYYLSNPAYGPPAVGEQ